MTPGLFMAVAAGGGLGAWARFRLSTWIYARTGDRFPWGTLAVNLTGSLLLGVAIPLLASTGAPDSMVSLLTVGVIGAFTTFSTFALEAVILIDDRRPLTAAVYIAVSLVLGLAAIGAGLLIGDLLH
jgi:fluoride exporter